MTQITQQLHITDISTAREIDKEPFDRVVTVCQDSIEDNVGDTPYEYFNMSDGQASASFGGSDAFEVFAQAAAAVEQALVLGETVLVHCHAGISRSVSVSAAALGSRREITYEEAFEMIQEERSQAWPNSYMVGQACRYIGCEEPDTWNRERRRELRSAAGDGGQTGFLWELEG